MHTPLSAENLLPNGPLRRVGHKFRLRRVGQHECLWVGARRRPAGRHGHCRRVPDTPGAAGSDTVGMHHAGRRSCSACCSRAPADSLLVKRSTMLAALAACEAVEACLRARPLLRWLMICCSPAASWRGYWSSPPNRRQPGRRHCGHWFSGSVSTASSSADISAVIWPRPPRRWRSSCRTRWTGPESAAAYSRVSIAI